MSSILRVKIFFFVKSIVVFDKPLPLHRVFHGIRFKVNKGWDSAESLFLFYALGAVMSS